MIKNIFRIFILCSGIFLFVACDSFLDELPDNRTDNNTAEKNAKLVVSAYSTSFPIVVYEQMSDNVSDRGSGYSWNDDNCKDAYLFNEKFSYTGTDSPYRLWEANYTAIAEANRALEALETIVSSKDIPAQRGEALLCRAYAHFTLVNIFCQAYNPQSSSTDLGIPYKTKVENKVQTQGERGTVEEVYKKIAEDIEEGLPLIDDNLYVQPKYHFTKVAANAFAAQFYLFYGDYNRAVKHATAAIGENPTDVLRNFDEWKTLTGGGEYTASWVNSKIATNQLLQGLYSVAGRMPYDSRAVHTNKLMKETLRSLGPWGDDYLIYGNYVRHYPGAISSYIFPKQMEYFVYTDPVQRIGQPHIMYVAFSADKTLLNRAEAYAMLGKYDLAAADLSYFYVAGSGKAASAETINTFYGNSSEQYKKTLAPRFVINSGMQENIIHACLHARRILTLHEGTRMLDLKRYGIAYSHIVNRSSEIRIEPYDKRLALQIPNAVILAGIAPNPR